MRTRADPAWHSPGVTFNLTDGSFTSSPCPAWPRWAQNVQMVHAELRKIASQPTAEPPPPPRPVSVIIAGLAIEDIIAKPTAVQADHPSAQLRQGKHDRWEIWLSKHPPSQ